MSALADVLSADDLLAGAGATHTVEVPPEVLDPGAPDGEPGRVVLRPLVLADVQRVHKAAREDGALTSVLMARACFELAREFGWTPDECAALTVGQVLVYLELLGRRKAVEGEAAA